MTLLSEWLDQALTRYPRTSLLVAAVGVVLLMMVLSGVR